MGPIFSIVIGIISLMPAIIFIVIFKVILTILNRGKKKMTEDFYEAERNPKSKNIRGDINQESVSLIDEIKRIIKEEKEKEKKKDEKDSLGKTISENFKNKKNNSRPKGKRNDAFNKSNPSMSQRELKEKILQKKSSLNKNNEKSFDKDDKNILEDLDNIRQSSDKIYDREFIKECESDYIDYHEDDTNNEFDKLLNFDEDDLIKIQIYKEIFDEPLSLR